MSNKRKLFERSRIDFYYRIVTIAISFAYGVMISRALGPEGRGVFVFTVLVLPNIVFALANLGLEVSLNVVVGKRIKSLNTLHGDILFAAGLLTLISSFFYLLLTIFGFFTLVPDSLIILVCLSYFSTLYYGFATALMNGAGFIKQRSRINMLMVSLHLVSAVIPFVMRVENYYPYIYLYIFVFFLICLINFLYLFQKAGGIKFRINPNRYRKLVKFSSRSYGSEIASRLRQQIDQVIIARFVGAEFLGLYNQAISLARRSLVPSQSVTTSSWNVISKANKADARKLTISTIMRLSIISGILIVVGYYAALLIPFIYGEEFRPAIPMFRILLVGVCFRGASSVLPLYFFGNRKRPGLVMGVNWLGLIMQLCLIGAFSLFISVGYAVVWGSFLSYILVAGMFSWLFIREK